MKEQVLINKTWLDYRRCTVKSVIFVGMKFGDFFEKVHFNGGKGV